MRKKEQNGIEPSLFDKARKLPAPNLFLVIFCLLTLLSLIWYFIYIYLLAPFPYGVFGPKFANGSLFYQDVSDFFMDFFNINHMVASGNPYYVEGDKGGGSSYPPLILAIAKLFQLIGGVSETGRENRLTVTGIVSGVLYLAIFLFASFLLLSLWAKKQWIAMRERVFLYLSLLFSAPMIFLIDRGNYLTFAFLFTALFLVLYREKTAWKRELSLIFLAMAVGCKIYPAIFAFLLLREKKWGAFFRTVAYSAFFGFVPFLCFTYGLKNVVFFLENMTKFSTAPYEFWHKGYRYSTGYSNDVSIANFVNILVMWIRSCTPFSLPAWSGVVGKIMMGAFAIASVSGILLAKKEEDAILFCSGAIVLLPSPNFAYTLVMMIFPFLAFLAKTEKKKSSIILFVLFCVIFLPIDFGYLFSKWSHGLQHGYSVSNFLQCLAVISLVLYRYVVAVTDRLGVKHGSNQASLS